MDENSIETRGGIEDIQEEKQVDKLSELGKLSDNIEYQKLLPGYIEYWGSRPSAEEPYLHGTGSYALRRILTNGIKPRCDDSAVIGEVAVLNLGPKSYISLAIPSRGGEMIATTYAYASSLDPGLSYNADEHFQKDRVTRTIDAIGGKSDFIDRVLATEVQKHHIDDVDSMRETLEFETALIFENALQYGSYVFKPEKAQQRIDDLNKIQNGEITDFNTVHRLLFQSGIFRGQTDDYIQNRLSEIGEERSLIESGINDTVEQLKKRVSGYENLSQEERIEIEHQFPAVIMLEGKGAGIVDSHVPLLQERVSTGTISPEAIREIRVPMKDIPTVEGWLENSGLQGVKVTPLEYYEIHEVVESSK